MQIEILVKPIRKDKNITLRMLSRKSGLSKTHINDIENNRKMPSILSLECIAIALNVTTKDLYRVRR